MAVGRKDLWYLLVLVSKKSNLSDTPLTNLGLEFIVLGMSFISQDSP